MDLQDHGERFYGTTTIPLLRISPIQTMSKLTFNIRRSCGATLATGPRLSLRSLILFSGNHRSDPSRRKGRTQLRIRNSVARSRRQTLVRISFCEYATNTESPDYPFWKKNDISLRLRDDAWMIGRMYRSRVILSHGR